MYMKEEKINDRRKSYTRIFQLKSTEKSVRNPKFCKKNFTWSCDNNTQYGVTKDATNRASKYLVKQQVIQQEESVQSVRDTRAGS